MTARRAPSALLLTTTLVLTALNLRAAVTSVGALLRDLQLDLGISDTLAGVLTTLPVLSFGVFGLLTARIARRFGTSRTLVGALIMMTLGLAVRAAAPNAATLLAVTVPTLAGMAIGNVLVPVAVKSWFPHAVAKMTGYYSIAVLIGTAVPAAVSVPVAEWFSSWRVGLGIWALPAAVALLPWLAVRIATEAGQPMIATAAGSPGTSGRTAATEGPDVAALVRRNPQSWGLMFYLGVQSLEAYVIMGWMVAILQDAGVPASRAGALLALTLGLGAPLALIVPRMAARRDDQRPWVIMMSAMGVVGYLGLMLAPSAAPLLWSVVLGVSLGAFPLALLLIGMRARTPAGTAQLSSLTQGYGYLFATVGPVSVGALHDVTGTWQLPLGLLLALAVPKLLAGLVVGRPGFVDDPIPPTGRSR